MCGPTGIFWADLTPFSQTACVHADVRNYYTTSVDAGGHPLSFTRWREYNPLVGPAMGGKVIFMRPCIFH